MRRLILLCVALAANARAPRNLLRGRQEDGSVVAEKDAEIERLHAELQGHRASGRELAFGSSSTAACDGFVPNVHRKGTTIRVRSTSTTLAATCRRGPIRRRSSLESRTGKVSAGVWRWPETSYRGVRTGDRSHQGRAFPKFPRRPHSQAAAWRTRV